MDFHIIAGMKVYGINVIIFIKGNPMTKDRLMTTKEAARYLGVSAAFLERDRWAGARIPFVKVGSRAIRYEPTVLKAYIQQQRRRSTSDMGAV